MKTVAFADGIICPATPTFYFVPTTKKEVAATVVIRVLEFSWFRD